MPVMHDACVVDDTPSVHAAEPPSASLDRHVAAIQAGDERAFELVYRALAGPLIDFCTAILGDVSAAGDVVEDVFVSLWERRATWHPAQGIRAYLFVAVRRRAINVVRDRRRRGRAHHGMIAERHAPAMSSPPAPVDRSLDLAEQIEAVFHEIARLPDARRTAMTLCWQGGLSIPEIADIMGISRNAVAQHLSRGLKTLKQLLPDHLDD